MKPFLHHAHRVLRTLEDFGLDRRCIVDQSLSSNPLLVVDAGYSALILDFSDISVYLNEYVTLPDDDRILRDISLQFSRDGSLRTIGLDVDFEPDDKCPPDFLNNKHARTSYSEQPWEVQLLYDELQQTTHYLPKERTEHAIDCFIETALRLGIHLAEPSQDLKETTEVDTSDGSQRTLNRVEGLLTLLEDRLVVAPRHILLPEREGLRQLYVQRMAEGRYLIFNHFGVQFPYVLASQEELDHGAGRVVDQRLYFVAEDAAPQLWQKEIIAYHEYVEGIRNHSAAMRAEARLARELKVSERTFYAWRNALRTR